jgi:single-strand DNA-binding protein
MNEVTIVGNLTADPTYRLAELTGRGVVHFDLAVNRRRFDRESGEYADLGRPQGCGLRPLADHANDTLRKGHEVVVVGNFADDSYEKDGEKRRQMVLEAQVIAASLRFATAEVKKAQRMTATQQESKEAYDGE